MPDYTILYRDQNGQTAHSFHAACATEGRARVLAHAMKPPSAHWIELWRDSILLYTRPAMTMRLAS